MLWYIPGVRGEPDSMPQELSERAAAARALGCLYLDALVHEFVLPRTSDET